MKNIKLKNSTLLMAVGAVLVLAGLVILISTSQNSMVVDNSNGILSQDEAKALVNDTVIKIIDVYETPTSVFEVKQTKAELEKEEDEDEKTDEEETVPAEDDDVDLLAEEYYEVTNYESVVKSIYTEKGIEELEQTMFGDDMFVLKDGSVVRVLKKLPEDNRFKGNNISIGTTKVQKEKIQSEVTLTTYALKGDTLTYYVIVKDLVLVKKDNSWLVESFQYNNK